jgi:FdhD protein
MARQVNMAAMSASLPPRGATVDVPVRRVGKASDGLERDRLAVEAPLEIRVGGEAIGVLLRTPGNDEELVTGFLFTEGIVAAPDAVRSLARPAGLSAAERENVVEVELDPARSRLPAPRRFVAGSGCGACGKPSLAALELYAPPVTSRLALRRATLAALPERLRSAQPGFAETGGLHAAALFDADGALVAAREDIGRHNAVDKVIGWALGVRATPFSDLILQVSGRLGYEIVQKAIVAGLPCVAAVGAASSLAVELAGRYGVTLAAFVRPDRLNLYGDPSRVVG